MIPLYTALKLALPGVEIIYYGNKIGMIDTQVRLDQKKILFLSMLLCQKYFEIVHDALCNGIIRSIQVH